MRAWLSKEPQTLWEHLKLGSLFGLANFLYVASIVFLFYIIDFAPNSKPSVLVEMSEGIGAVVFFVFIVLPVSALAEEVIFRAVPLFIAVNVLASRLLFPVVLVSSVIFGYMHGGFINIAIQGVSGIIFSVAYLKWGGMRGAFLKPLIASTLVHAGSNTLVYAAMIVEVVITQGLA